jgi:electron transfer flavoprotein alpha subunit
VSTPHTLGPVFDGSPLAAVAVVVARDGRLPHGADEAVAEAGGAAVVVGSGAEAGAAALAGARHVWWSDTGDGLRPGALAGALAPLLQGVPMVVMPASPDGRDLAPRLAAAGGHHLVARAVRAELIADDDPGGGVLVRATVSRLDDRVVVPVDVNGPAVVTLVPSGRSVTPATTGPLVEHLPLALPPAGPPGTGSHTGQPAGTILDPQVVAILEPDLHTMDLADATRVLAGGAGLVPGADDRRAAAVFDLLVRVSAALGGSAGATRVATDAGWIGYERQIGTTGVTIDPDLYVAFGVSGAAQHVGGLGAPRHIVSVNTDASSPMTAMADLGLVTDAQALLLELARRLGVAEPAAASSDDPPPADDRTEAARG